MHCRGRTFGSGLHLVLVIYDTGIPVHTFKLAFYGSFCRALEMENTQSEKSVRDEVKGFDQLSEAVTLGKSIEWWLQSRYGGWEIFLLA